MEALIASLNLLGVYYDVVNEFEVVVEAPADIIPADDFYNNENLKEADIINHPEVACYTDGAKIFIEVDEQGHLNWLIALPDYLNEKD